MYPAGYYQGMLGKPFCFLPPASNFRAFSLGQQHISQHGQSGTSFTRFSTFFPCNARSFSSKTIFEPIRNTISDTIKEIENIEQEGGTTKISFPPRFTTSADPTVIPIGSPPSSTEMKKSFACPQCKYSTDRKNNLKRHVITMHFDCDRKLECCGTVFRSKAKLREHVTLFHKNGYRCLVCARMFCRKALLRRHMAVHSGKKDFHCDYCSYATSHKSNLERHQKVHAKASASRFVYSPRKLIATFERKLYTIEGINGIRSNDVTCQYKPTEDELGAVDHLESETEMETSEKYILSGAKVCKENSNDNQDIVNTHLSPEIQKVNDNVKERTSGSTFNKDNNSHFVFGLPCRFENEMNSFSREFHFNSDRNKQNRDGKELPMFKESGMCNFKIDETVSECDVSCVLNKENVDGGDTEFGDNNNNYNETIKKKCSLRLCGLPYRCSNCGLRFESQDKLVHHACANGGADIARIAENSVSLVALILKKGNKLVAF